MELAAARDAFICVGRSVHPAAPQQLYLQSRHMLACVACRYISIRVAAVCHNPIRRLQLLLSTLGADVTLPRLT